MRQAMTLTVSGDVVTATVSNPAPGRDERSVMAIPGLPRSSASRRGLGSPDVSSAFPCVVLRVASWNVRHAAGVGRAADLGAVAATIAALDVDVVALQEVDRLQIRSGGVDQLDELAARLGWHGLFGATIVGGPGAARPASAQAAADACPAYGIGLLSRHPLTACSTVRIPPERGPGLDDEPRILLRAAVDTIVGQVWVGATHLSWLPWTARRQLRTVLGMVAGPGLGVLCGDLNLPRRSVAAATAGTGWSAARAGATFPARAPVLQLDHILVRGCRLAEPRAGQAGPSDHRPVSAAVVVEQPVSSSGVPLVPGR